MQRMAAETKANFYAVAVGRRPGIYSSWKNAKLQVFKYRDAAHKRFDTLEEAQEFMARERIFPPGAKTFFDPSKTTPIPPAHLNPEYDFEESDSDEDMPDLLPFVQVAPSWVNEDGFDRVRRMSERIANDDMNQYIDPSSFECNSNKCTTARATRDYSDSCS